MMTVGFTLTLRTRPANTWTLRLFSNPTRNHRLTAASAMTMRHLVTKFVQKTRRHLQDIKNVKRNLLRPAGMLNALKRKYFPSNSCSNTKSYTKTFATKQFGLILEHIGFFYQCSKLPRRVSIQVKRWKCRSCCWCQGEKFRGRWWRSRSASWFRWSGLTIQESQKQRPRWVVNFHQMRSGMV